jgi:hypothetical protein
MARGRKRVIEDCNSKSDSESEFEEESSSSDQEDGRGTEKNMYEVKIREFLAVLYQWRSFELLPSCLEL